MSSSEQTKTNRHVTTERASCHLKNVVSTFSTKPPLYTSADLGLFICFSSGLDIWQSFASLSGAFQPDASLIKINFAATKCTKTMLCLTRKLSLGSLPLLPFQNGYVMTIICIHLNYSNALSLGTCCGSCQGCIEVVTGF